MKNIIFLSIAILISCVAQTQQSEYNLSKGEIADGYDVVSYFEGVPTKGKKEFTATLDKVKFRFSSQENLDTFLENPNQYIPQYGGYCAYAVAVNNSKVSINPKAYEIRDGKLYLFYKNIAVNTLQKWQDESPAALQKKADQNWKSLKKK